MHVPFSVYNLLFRLTNAQIFREKFISKILRHVSMYLHHIQGVFSYLAKVNKLIQLITLKS